MLHLSLIIDTLQQAKACALTQAFACCHKRTKVVMCIFLDNWLTLKNARATYLSLLGTKLQVLNFVIQLFEILPQHHLALLLCLWIYLLIVQQKMLQFLQAFVLCKYYS